MRFESTDLSCVIDGRAYKWFGGFGAVLKSREYGVSQGDVRMLGNKLFFAYLVRFPGMLRRPEICWIPCIEFDMEWVRAFKREVFA